MAGDMLHAVRQGNDYIDVEIKLLFSQNLDSFMNKKFLSAKNNDLNLEIYVKIIRIRCVKANSNRKFTASQKEYFNKYVEKIEEYANGDPDLREMAFNATEIERFNLANPAEDNNRMSDLMNAFNGLCHETKKRISNRYNQNIDSNINIRYQAPNDKRINFVKDFTKTKEIKLFRSNLPKINPKWFNAAHLETLDLCRVYPFDFDEAGQWKIFANGIKNCQKLKSLKFHDCGIKEIPDFVFEALPESLINLTLGDNNIKRISPKISRLKYLNALNVSCNAELTDDGFPWKFLPETLHMLDLSETDLKQIPSDVKRLKELERLIIGNSVGYIKWKCLPQSLDELTVDGDGKLNILRSMRRFYLFRVLVLRNAGLKVCGRGRFCGLRQRF
uniref:Uncharacterized protein n=1 Tax=Panagrolaimus superbus TaxID=310955 RepID=A0A914YY28_9BILA